MSNNYQEKYLKYKNKYLELKRQIMEQNGGNPYVNDPYANVSAPGTPPPLPPRGHTPPPPPPPPRNPTPPLVPPRIVGGFCVGPCSCGSCLSARSPSIDPAQPNTA